MLEDKIKKSSQQARPIRYRDEKLTVEIMRIGKRLNKFEFNLEADFILRF